MKPIAPPVIIDKGIVVYAPSLPSYRMIKLEIFYTQSNPIFSWIQCDSEQKIWDSMVEQGENGTLFVYHTLVNLNKGFYNLILTAYQASGYRATGNCLIGLIESKETLHIGLPYSAFPPISMS